MIEYDDMSINSAPTPENNPVNREKVLEMLKLGGPEALAVFTNWCIEEEKKVRDSKDTLDLELRKAELLLEAECYAEVQDILMALETAGSDLDQYPDFVERYSKLLRVLDSL